MSKPRPLDRPLTIAEILRFWEKVDRNAPGGCWLWIGKLDLHGNGQYCVQYRTVSARRLAWELEHPDHDPLRPGIKLYANCGHKDCVNPAHTLIRIGGGNIPRTHCKRGHEMTEENIVITTQGKRACRECVRITTRARRKRYLKEGRGWGSSYTPLTNERKSA